MSKNEAKPTSAKVSDGKLPYKPHEIELKWQSKWKEEAVYQPDLNSAKRPFYNLMMFPYPSAEGLHIGSIFTFGGVDVYARFKRMRGYDVFEPIGLDGFGIHSENHALKTGTHPFDHAKRTEENFYRQLHSTGISFAWGNKLETYDPAYYKWTQWLFIELFKAGLAYKKKSPVNFCPSCKTVLADEQVIDGKCERCNSVVEKRDLEQWFFKITDYAERLLTNIEGLNWTDKVKIAQRNWIGRSEGALIEFKVQSSKFKIEVFTTRPDTLHGATFLVISPEHPLVSELRFTNNEPEVINYVSKALAKSEQERLTEGREKTGVDTGYKAINPVTNEEIPIWIADYVLGGYGTGAIMAVPAHDQRDNEFARKYNLPIKEVIKRTFESSHVPFDVKDQDLIKFAAAKLNEKQQEQGKLYEGKIGQLINSGDWTGWRMPESMDKVFVYLGEKRFGKKEVTYHLRDWLISRQRYWGPPIPMIYCESCARSGKSWFDIDASVKEKHPEGMEGWYPAEDLPVKLPYVEDYKPMGTGKAPLANYPEFYETTCPHCGGKATRETDVSDTFLDSAWYFLRYLATDSDEAPFPSHKFNDSKLAGRERFLPVTMYIGGAEHSVLHLLYARFVTMVLKDLGYVDFEEPFARFYAHGLIIKDGAKMSKSKGNVINPDEYIKKYGADAVRCYLLFLGPFNQGGDFRDTGMEGMHRFTKRIWALFTSQSITGDEVDSSAKSMMNETIKGVTEDLEELRYNTALAKLMTWYNFLVKQPRISHQEANVYLQLLAPLAPHMTEELWQMLGNDFSIHTSAWPEYDEKQILHETVNLAVQVNGKLRSVLVLDSNSPKDELGIRELAKQDPAIAKFLEGKSIKKVIYVVGKILNFVVA